MSGCRRPPSPQSVLSLDVLTAHPFDEAAEALSDQLGVLHHIGGVRYDAGDDDFALREREIVPHGVLVLVADVPCLEGEVLGIGAQAQVRDVLELDVRGVRPVPGAPADVQPDQLRVDAPQRVVQGVDAQLGERPVVLNGGRWGDLVPVLGEAGVIELEDEARRR